VVCLTFSWSTQDDWRKTLLNRIISFITMWVDSNSKTLPTRRESSPPDGDRGLCRGHRPNHGYPDLFITQWGQNVLYRNLGNGTFKDDTKDRGLLSPKPRWSTGCAFLDFNRDGFLDLVVVHYVDFDLWLIAEPVRHFQQRLYADLLARDFLLLDYTATEQNLRSLPAPRVSGSCSGNSCLRVARTGPGQRCQRDRILRLAGKSLHIGWLSIGDEEVLDTFDESV
jgi:hypothetical protein